MAFITHRYYKIRGPTSFMLTGSPELSLGGRRFRGTLVEFVFNRNGGGLKYKRKGNDRMKNRTKS